MSIDVVLRAQRRGRLSVYPVESVAQYGIDAFVTDRFAGTSAAPYASLNLGDHVGDAPDCVQENRCLVAEAVEVEPSNLVIIRQVHGSVVLEASDVTPATEADGLFSDESDVALCMLVADCVPVLLVDTASTRFSVVHAGWRGLHAGVIASALSKFSSAHSVQAFIGPSISREAYQVGPDVAKHFSHIDGVLLPDGGNRSRLDLRRVTTEQLLAFGVSRSAIVQSQQVTDGGEVFFSDRAQRPCGRFALVAKRSS